MKEPETQTERLDYTLKHNNWDERNINLRIYRHMLELSRRLDAIEEARYDRPINHGS
jgi:hypothetical protein